MRIFPRKVIELKWENYEAKITLWALRFHKERLGLSHKYLTDEILGQTFVDEYSDEIRSRIISELNEFETFEDILPVSHSKSRIPFPKYLEIKNSKRTLMNEMHYGLLYQYYSNTPKTRKIFRNPSIKFESPLKWNDIFEAKFSDEQENWKSLESPYLIASCFSTKWNNLLMWAHYSGSFSGFCIGYQIYEGTFQDQDVRHKCGIFPVSYYQVAPKFPSNADALIATSKSIEWSYEDEYRLILADFIPGLYEIGFDSIREIILGPRCENNLAKKLALKASEKSGLCKIYQATKAKGIYEIDRYEI